MFTTPSRPSTLRTVRRKYLPASAVIFCICLLVTTPVLLLWTFYSHEKPPEPKPVQQSSQTEARRSSISLPAPRKQADTLVLYVFSNTDAEYEKNLRFFLKHGVSADDGCDYLIILQEGDKSPPLASRPEVPPNVRFETHPNECYDWGTMGWALRNNLVDPDLYTYFIFMNSSVRGPFLPPYLTGKVRWQDILISRLSERVKLVGPTISCEGSPKDGNVTGEWRTNPHVQSYVVATDRIGFNAMWQDGTVFGCYTSMWDVIFYSELGSTWSVLAAGYTIDSLMLRYQGVDWSNMENWGCNAGINPYGEYYYDGVTIDPFEVIFVKVKELLLERGWMYSVHASKYDHWLQEQAAHRDKPDIITNVWQSDPWSLKSIRIGHMRFIGQGCFDTEFYRQNNWDREMITDPNMLWEHWVQSGQFEARPHRFLCDLTLQ